MPSSVQPTARDVEQPLRLDLGVRRVGVDEELHHGAGRTAGPEQGGDDAPGVDPVLDVIGQDVEEGIEHEPETREDERPPVIAGMIDWNRAHVARMFPKLARVTPSPPLLTASPA